MTLDIEFAKMDLTSMIRMAERQNPKRAFLFVSKILGRHIPVRADRHRDILEALALQVSEEIDTGSDVLVMGYAETAVGLGAGVHDALLQHMAGGRIGYLPTTRHPDGREVWAGFSEDHSHATAHHILTPHHPGLREIATAAPTLVLVDDETTTGRTFANLIAALSGAGRVFDHICLVTLTDWSGGEVQSLIPEFSGVEAGRISGVSLIGGRWSWTPAKGLEDQQIPASAEPLQNCGIDAGAGLWRAGIVGETRPASSQLLQWLKEHPAGPVLVIGTGEYVWQPFRVAEDLSAAGYEASFLATTRSPVLKGETIRQKAQFSDHYGLGVPMYLHNVNPEDWGAIVLMVESENLSCIDPALAGYLGDFAVLTPSGNLVHFSKGKASQ